MSDDTHSAIELAAKRAFIKHSRGAISEVLSDLNTSDVSFDNALDKSARLLHTIKGGAGFLKFREIASIAGDLEQMIRCKTAGLIPVFVQRLKIGLQELESKIQEIDAGARADGLKDITSSK